MRLKWMFCAAAAAVLGAAGAFALLGPAQAGTDDAAVELSFVNRHLILNGAFGVWDGNVPRRWQAQNARGVRKVEEGAYTGLYAVGLDKLPGEAWVMLEYPIRANETILGGRLRASIVGKADAKELLALGVRYTVDGETERRKTYHPGTGVWRTLVIERTIPENADPASLVIEVFREPGKDGEAIFDQARLVITK